MPDFVGPSTHQAIGRVVVNCAELDGTLSNLLADLIRSDEARILSAGQAFDWLATAIWRVFEEHWDGDGDALKELLNKARELHKKRDLIVHGEWLPGDFEAAFADEPTTRLMALRRRRWNDGLSGELTDDVKMNQLADQIATLNGEFRQWRENNLTPAAQRRIRSGAAELEERLRDAPHLD